MPELSTPVAGRFAFSGWLAATPASRPWLALELDTGRHVVAAAVDAGRAATLARASGTKHRHLAAVIDVVTGVERASLPEGVTLLEGGGIAVAEYVPGKNLKQLLTAGKIAPLRAVAWTLRLAEAVQSLHRAGAVHGAISPWSVIAEAEGRKIAPVLAQLTAPAFGRYCAPERLKGAAETPADDVWSLYAVLYSMLTAQAPFAAATREAWLKAALTGRPRPLADFGVVEPALQEIVHRGLIGERRLRAAELTELVHALDAWERDPTKMPPKRAAPPRATPRLGDIVGGAGLGTAKDDGVVFDEGALPEAFSESRPPPLASVTPRAPSAASVAPLPPIASAAPPIVSAAPPIASAAPLPPPTSSSPFAAAPSGSSPYGAPPPETASASTSSSPHASAVPPPPSRPSVNPFERKRRVWPLVLGAAALSGGVVYLAISPAAQAPSPAAVEAIAAPTRAAASPARATPPKRDPSRERDSCVASYLPEGAAAPQESYAFVCGDMDFREIATRLHQPAPPPAPSALVSATAVASARPLNESGLSWYELPATAVIRRHCCPDAAPLTLPETPGWCEQLGTVVRRLADDSSKSGDLAPAARNFDKAVNCLFANRSLRPYVYDKPPTDANRQAFQQFLGRAAVSEARR